MTMPQLTAFYFSLVLVVGCCQFVRAQNEANTTCIEFYEQAKESVLGNVGNRERLLNAFYPLNTSSPHLVSVYYFVNYCEFDDCYSDLPSICHEEIPDEDPTIRQLFPDHYYALADQPLWLTFDTYLLFALTPTFYLLFDGYGTCLELSIDPLCNETKFADQLGLLTSWLRSYTTEGGAGRDFVRIDDYDVIPDKFIYIYALSIQLTGVVFHAAITLKAYKFFKKSFMHFFFATFLIATMTSPPLLPNVVKFLIYFNGSAESFQWLFILPCMPAFVAPVLCTPCLGYSCVCWRRKGKKQLESYLCNPLAIIVCILTLPFTVMFTSLIFWSIMSVAMYPFELGLGVIVFAFPCSLYLSIFYFWLQNIVACFKRSYPQTPQLVAPPELARAQFVENTLFRGSILSLIFAFSMMYYVLIVHNRMINSWNPLQSFFSVALPTAACTAVMWGMRKLHKATNEKQDNIGRTNVTHGEDSSDEDSHVQLLRNRQP